MQSSRSKKVNRAWLHDHLNDPYVKLAQRHHYRARAAFKLIGIDEQDHLIRPGMTVVDLGSAPGFRRSGRYVTSRLGYLGTRSPPTIPPTFFFNDSSST